MNATAEKEQNKVNVNIMVKISFSLGDSTSSNNSFYCPHCKKRTLHYRLTLTESSAINYPDDKWGLACSKFFDITGLTKFYGTLMGNSCWKCDNCGLSTMRKSNGEIFDIGKFGK